MSDARQRHLTEFIALAILEHEDAEAARGSSDMTDAQLKGLTAQPPK